MIKFIVKALVISAVVAVVFATSAVALEPVDKNAKLRILVADFRPEKVGSLTEAELDFCKMLQRGVEGELVSWFEVEESTKYGSIQKGLANVSTEQAARTLAEKAGVNQVVTGSVTKAGNTAVVMLHFVEVPRGEQAGVEPKVVILRNIQVTSKVDTEDNWIALLDKLQQKINVAFGGEEATIPPETGVKPPDTGIKPPAISDDEVKLRKAQALRAIDQNKFADAAKTLDELLGLLDNDGEAWYIRGVVYFFQDKLPEAIAAYNNAVKNNYDRASVHEDLANTYWRMAFKYPKDSRKNYQAALSQADAALKLAPTDPWAYNIIGCVTYVTAGKDMGKLKAAAGALTKATELLTSDPALWDNAANAHFALGELDEAARFAKEAIAIADRNNEPYPKALDTLKRIQESQRNKGTR